MKALNRKERKLAQWTVVLFFLPMLATVILGASLHFRVMNMQIGDLDEKERQYDKMFRVQAKKGEIVDVITNKLELLYDPNLSFARHQTIQKEISSCILDLQKIAPSTPDTSRSDIRNFPPIYDSLIVCIRLSQSTRDSVKTVIELNKNLTFQLNQCRKAVKNEIAQNKKKR